MKDNTIHAKASLLLKKDNIRARLEELRQPSIYSTQLSLKRTLLELSKIAFFDIQDLFDDEGILLPFSELDSSTTGAIKSIRVSDVISNGKVIGRKVSIDLWDKNAALDKLMKHLGGYEKQNNNKEDLLLSNLYKQVMGTSLPVKN